LVERRIEGAPSDAQALLLGAELAAEVGHTEDAARRYERLLALQPAATRLWLPLAGLYRELGRAEEAERAMAQRGPGTVVAQDGRMAAVRRLAAGTDRSLLEAVSAFRVGRFDLAARGFEAALRLRPDDLEVRTNLAVTYLRLNRREAAAEQLAAVLEQDSEFAPAWTQLGTLQLMNGAEGAAIATLRRSLELDPRQTGARSNLAIALLRSGDVRGALEAYQQVAAEDPTHSAARYGEAVCRSRLGQWREARELLENELERRSGGRELEIALARLLAAAPVGELRDGTRALELARAAIAAGEDLPALETLAMAFAESGDYAAARDAQRRALGQVQRLSAPDRARTEARLRADLERYARGEPCRDPALG
ncbi:MAG TPA: tetratricopeptide repeat protein, partial [Thermoanaerobaculia bacterium]|nr:tetratricopeptide repeat protein [Thermoanaerobaculia bacterium]